MTVKFTIIGLGQIGASIGLALGEHSDKVTRFGHDREPNIAKQAQKMGAVDKVFYNLPASVEHADVVLLALPFDQIHETLQIIAPCLQENTVIMETSPVKSAVSRWMKDLLSPNRYYVGLVPAINPKYLLAVERGVKSAHSDMFSKGLMAIVAPQGTVSEAIKLGADLTSMLGANPFFADLEELDGIMTALHILPQLAAAAITNVVMVRPGWKDAQKLAGGVFAEATAPIAFEAETNTLVESTLQNRESVVRVLDEMVASLGELKKKISGQEQENLTDWLESVRGDHSRWWQDRKAGDWPANDFKRINPNKGDFWKRLFGDMGKLFGTSKYGKDEEKK